MLAFPRQSEQPRESLVQNLPSSPFCPVQKNERIGSKAPTQTPVLMSFLAFPATVQGDERGGRASGTAHAAGTPATEQPVIPGTETYSNTQASKVQCHTHFCQSGVTPPELGKDADTSVSPD